MDFVMEQYLKQHFKNVHAKMIYRKCEFCCKELTRTGFYTHMKPKNLNCKVCDEFFVLKCMFTMHISTHKEEELRKCGKFACELCDRRFDASYALDVHVNRDHGLKPYKCELCGLSYTYRSGLKLHKLKHNDKKDYKCEICEKEYIFQSQLRNHQRQNHSMSFISDTMVKCELCDRDCIGAIGLKRHMKTHS